MESRVLKPEMRPVEMFDAMMEGNPQVSGILMQMFYEDAGCRNILYCDEINVRGERLVSLYNNCCNMDFNTFRRTLVMIKTGVYSLEELNANLALERPIPFVTEEVVIKGVPVYKGTFEPDEKGWQEYCLKNRAAFLDRFATASKEENGPTRSLKEA